MSPRHPGNEHGGRRDDEVVTRAKSGDPDAWRDLYQANAARLRAWVIALPTGDAAFDADDVVATAWLTASRRVLEFTGSRREFSGWLFGIARNVVRTVRARSGRRSTAPTDVQTTDPAMWGVVSDASARVDGADLALRLTRRLSPREAEVVACLHVAGFDVTTTARILGISEIAVRVSHHRGISRLRSLLAADPRISAQAGLAHRPIRVRPAPGVS